MSFGIDIDLHSGNSCCDHSMESADHRDHDQEDEKKNCCNTICDCLCCGHLFTFNELKVFHPEPLVAISESIIDYTFSYTYNFSSGFWQPPRPSKA